MKSSWMRVTVLVAGLACAASAQQSGTELPSGERAALEALERPALETLRAADAAAPAALSAAEREALAQAQARHADLAGQRAGELSDHDIKLILGTAAVVIVIALLL